MYGPLPVGTEMCVREKGGELIRPNYTLENFVVFEENINSLVLTYAPGVNVFPTRSGFTPTWTYIHPGVKPERAGNTLTPGA